MTMNVVYIGNFKRMETGGTLRAYEVVRRIHRYGVKPYVIHLPALSKSRVARIGALKSIEEYIVSTCSIIPKDIDLVVATSESPSCTLAAHSIAKRIKAPWTTVMQSPIKLKYTPASMEPILIDPLWLPQLVRTLSLLSKIRVLVVSESVIIDSSIRIPKYLVIRPSVGIEFERYTQVKCEEKVFDGVFMARLTNEKGIFDLLKVWKRVTNVVKDVKLALIGKFKNERTRLDFLKYASKLGIIKNIMYLGYLSGISKIKILKASKVFIYPSKLDSFPIVCLEALACGLPITAYDISAITLNYPIETVIKVPKENIEAMAEAVLDILQNYDNWYDKAEKIGINFAKKFTWDNVTSVEAKLYKELISE
ncbi:MAG: glycosyltransferase [Ignisphaera sp.]